MLVFAAYFDAGETTSRAFVTDTPPPVIEIRDLHKSYGALEVLKGVDMIAPRGHVVSLIGSSGSGKSTLLRCANLLEDSQQGEIIFEGKPMHFEDPRESIAAGIATVYQDLAMIP